MVTHKNSRKKEKKHRNGYPLRAITPTDKMASERQYKKRGYPLFGKVTLFFFSGVSGGYPKSYPILGVGNHLGNRKNGVRTPKNGSGYPVTQVTHFFLRT